MSEGNKSIALDSFYGLKAGMTRIFDENGVHQPVTIVKLIPNKVSQVKTTDKEGYEAYQVAFKEKREKLVSKPTQGHLAKANIEQKFTAFREVRVETATAEDLGKEVDYTQFEKDTYVDVTGVSKGKGFQGVIKRYGFSGGPATHGSKFHRTPGSIGNRATPGKVFKNKKMPGHMGAKQKTVQNIKVLEVNLENNYMLIRGSIPGAKNSMVRISKSVKKS